MARKFVSGTPTVGDTPVVLETRTITATAPVTIAGTTSADLSANRTIAVSAASTSAAGVVQLSDSTSTTGSTKAATETAVKAAYDIGAAAIPKSTVTTAGDLIVATGSGAVTRLAAGASGAALVGTGAGSAPSYSTTINGTAIPSSKTLVVTTDKLSVHAATTSAELAGVISDETGSGSLVFGTTPTIATPALTLSTTTSTADGRIAWDATNDDIVVGTGAATVTFGPLGSTNGAALGAAAAGTATTSARADHVHPTTGVIANTLADAKGDLIVASGADAFTRLAVGNSGAFLIADADATNGVSWSGMYPVTGDVTVANSTTFATATGMSGAVAASKKYLIRGCVLFDTTGAGDFKFQFTGPASPTLVRIFCITNTPGAVILASVVQTAFSTSQAITGNASTGGAVQFHGVVHTSAGNSGTIAFEFAQNSQSNDSGAVVRAGSYLEIIRIA